MRIEKIKIPLFCIIITCLSSSFYAQNSIPEFTGTNLDKEKITFPSDLIGKKTLLGFAFSKQSQDDIQSWAQPVYDEFIDKESLASLVYDVNVYLVIVLSKSGNAFREKVEKELRENILKEFYPNIIICDAERKDIREKLNIVEKDVPTLYALDKNAGIKQKESGAFSMKKLERLSAHLEMEN